MHSRGDTWRASSTSQNGSRVASVVAMARQDDREGAFEVGQVIQGIGQGAGALRGAWLSDPSGTQKTSRSATSIDR